MKVFFLVVLFFLFSPRLFADSGTEPPVGDLVLSDGVLGVNVTLDPAGNLLSATSSFSHPVDFPDRRGISKAYIVAEEKAKAQLVRFMSQDVTTHRIVSEQDQATEKASRGRTDKGSNWSKDVARNAQESLTEISTSLAQGRLNGVRILSRVYDEPGEQVTVVIGINQQSQVAAGQIGPGLSMPAPYSTADTFPGQGSEAVMAIDFVKF